MKISKKDFPSIPNDISEMIKRESSLHMETAPKTKLFNQTYLKKCIVYVFVVMIISGTTVFAVNIISNIKTNKVGEYGQETIVSDNTSTEYELNHSKNVPISLKLEYLPENTQATEFNTGQVRIINKSTNSGVASIHCMLLDDNEFTITDNYVENSVNFEGLNYSASYLKFDSVNGSKQKVYALFNDINCLMIIYIDVDMDISEVKKLVDGLKPMLANNDADDNIIYAVRFEPDYFKPNIPYIPTLDYTPTQKRLMCDIHCIGDKIELYEDRYQNQAFSATVSDVQVYTNINELDSQMVSEITNNSSDFIDENGNFKNEIFNYYTIGDGIYSSYQLKHTEEVPVKLVYITLEYTAKTHIPDLCFNWGLYLIDESENDFYIYNRFANITFKYDIIQPTYYDTSHSYNNNISCIYFTNDVNPKEKNHFYNMKPGETRYAYIAYIVTEDQLSHIYLSLEDENTSQSLSSDNIPNGLFDIRQ